MSQPAGRLRLATRGSPLAVAQAERVSAWLRADDPLLEVSLVIVDTQGDRDQSASLREIGGQGIFVKEVQRALLEGDADLAVHSAKDLPSTTPDGLVLASVPERLDAADVLVGRSLDGLGPGGRVATGSPRRRALLQERRPDLDLVELRGNMATRLAAPGTGGIDAIVAARAALERLELLDVVAERLDPSWFTPQVAQGAIALEAIEGSEHAARAARIDDPASHRCVVAERSFLVAAGAGCSVPAGAWCTIDGDELVLRAVAKADGSPALRRSERRGADPIELGALCAADVGLVA